MISFSHCQFCRFKSEGPKCAAFAAIPHDILMGESPHDKPRVGDGGIVFSPRDDLSLTEKKTLEGMFKGS